MTEKIFTPGATPSRLKYLKCECCSFLAVIPRHDRHEGLLCPFCTKVQCAHGGKFFEVTRDTFENEADLDTPRSEIAGPEKRYDLQDMENHCMLAASKMHEACVEAVRGEFLDDPTNEADDIAYQHAIEDCLKALNDIGDETPRSAIAKRDPFIVWEVENKTTRVLFSTKEDADKFVSTFPASVAGGMRIQEVGVL